VTYYYDNKFVLTEDESYLVPYRREFCFPPISRHPPRDLRLGDPGVCREVRDKLAMGLIVVGDYFPKTKEVIIQVPLETSDYVERRIEEVFGQ
jgi:hypothetical protein